MRARSNSRLMGLIAGIALATTIQPAMADAHEADSARFRLDIDITWTADTHPFDYPAGAHMSGLVGASHNSRFVLFADGRTASSGLELVAENGRASVMLAELSEGMRRNRVAAVFEAGGLRTLPGRITATFTADPNRRFVSFATMIAPSPDWFTGAAGIDLRDGDGWIERLEIPLWAWDAGTDSGANYTAADTDTQPRESVRLLATPHFLTAAGLTAVGVARIERLE